MLKRSREQKIGAIVKVWRNANQQIVETLDADQKRRWDELVGPSVPGELNFPLPPPDAEN